MTTIQIGDMVRRAKPDKRGPDTTGEVKKLSNTRFGKTYADRQFALVDWRNDSVSGWIDCYKLVQWPTDAQLSLKVGDSVEVTRDLGEVETRKVRTEPWQLGHGAWVIGLEGISGGYDLLRCKPLESASS